MDDAFKGAKFSQNSQISIEGVLTFNFFRKSLIAIAFNRIIIGAEIIAEASLTSWAFIKTDISRFTLQGTNLSLHIRIYNLRKHLRLSTHSSATKNDCWLLFPFNQRGWNHSNTKTFRMMQTKLCISIILIAQSKLKKEKT